MCVNVSKALYMYSCTWVSGEIKKQSRQRAHLTSVSCRSRIILRQDSQWCSISRSSISHSITACQTFHWTDHLKSVKIRHSKLVIQLTELPPAGWVYHLQLRLQDLTREKTPNIVRLNSLVRWTEWHHDCMGRRVLALNSDNYLCD